MIKSILALSLTLFTAVASATGVTFNWPAQTLNSDGSALSADSISNYTIYSDDGTVIATPAGTETAHTADINLGLGDNCFVITTTATYLENDAMVEREGEASDPACVSIIVTPAKIEGLDVTVNFTASP